jgi:hypothetical protein
MSSAVLVTGDYTTLLYGDLVPRKGVAVRGIDVFDDGQYLGRTISTPARAAFEYVVEPDGDSLRIYYTPESK